MTNSQWQQIGVWRGGTVTTVRCAGNRLFAGSRAGLLYTDNGGVNWQRSGTELRDPSVTALAANHDGTYIFFASESGRLYRSTDGGVEWTEVDGWAGLGLITDIALSPDYTQDTTIFVATAEGPFRSQDGGASWESAVFGLVDLEVLCIAVDPDFAQSETLWIGTANGGLYKSRNAGRSWRDAGNGLPDEAVQALLAVKTAGDTLLLAGMEYEGIFRSVDGGDSWQPVQANMDVNCLAARADGLVLAGSDAGILISQDSGMSWRLSAEEGLLSLSIAFLKDGTAAAATWQTGVATSPDGAQWEPTETIPAFHAPPLAVRTAEGQISLSDVDGGWAISSDGGVTWLMAEIDAAVTALASSGNKVMGAAGMKLYTIDGDQFEALELPCEVTHLALSPNHAEDGVIFAAMIDEIEDAEPLLLRSEDNGETWRRLPPPWQDRAVLGLQCSPRYSEDQSIFAITVLPQESDYSIEIWQSADQGDSWIDLAAFNSPIPIAPFVSVGNDARSLFIANGERVFHLYTNPDDGNLAVSQETLPGEERVTAFSAAADGTLYAATSHGVWRREGGWHPVGSGLEDEIIVAVLPGAEDLLAVALGGVIWRLS